MGQDPSDGDLAEATNMTVVQLRKNLVVGQAARNKLVKVSVRYSFFCFKIELVSSDSNIKLVVWDKKE